MNFLLAFLGYLLVLSCFVGVLAIIIWLFKLHVFAGLAALLVICAASLAADMA